MPIMKIFRQTVAPAQALVTRQLNLRRGAVSPLITAPKVDSDQLALLSKTVQAQRPTALQSFDRLPAEMKALLSAETKALLPLEIEAPEAPVILPFKPWWPTFTLSIGHPTEDGRGTLAGTHASIAWQGGWAHIYGDLRVVLAPSQHVRLLDLAYWCPNPQARAHAHSMTVTAKGPWAEDGPGRTMAFTCSPTGHSDEIRISVIVNPAKFETEVSFDHPQYTWAFLELVVHELDM